MIPEESLELGVRRLAGHIIANPGDEWVLCDRMTLTVGRKIRHGA
jgi:hypothetical protein